MVFSLSELKFEEKLRKCRSTAEDPGSVKPGLVPINFLDTPKPASEEANTPQTSSR